MSKSVVEAAVRSLEERFWIGDAAFYRQNLRPDAVMLFAPPVGVLVGDSIVAAVASGPRWARVSFDEVRFVHLGEEAVIVAYLARARRVGEQGVYSAYAASAYVQQDGAWMLAFHQQTPAQDAASE